MTLAQIQSKHVGKSKVQSLKMPDWEQLVTVGVADAWRVVRKEVFISITNRVCQCNNQSVFCRWRRSCFLDFWLCRICFKLTSMT